MTLPQDIIVEQIFLRVPPDDPARLLRGALVCKHWARLLAHRDFRRRYGERHGGLPPLLGFVANKISTDGVARFVPTLAFSPALRHDGYRAHDARHGRVLLNRIMGGGSGASHALALNSWNAAVLCASSSCYGHHLDCRPGHFLVAFVGMDAKEMFARVYSSESAAWGKVTSARLPGSHFHDKLSGALARNAIYFVLGPEHGMVKYDLATGKLSLVAVPETLTLDGWRLMTTEDGGLGFAELNLHSTLTLWSMVDEGRWAVSRAIDLTDRLPVIALAVSTCMVAFADIAGVIFLRTTDGLYTYDLKTEQSILVMDNDFYGIIPYASFYTPVLRVATTCEGSASTS
ncbi:hypothetical protein ZEAMMB73_Zm00001d018674 [Zea mays]|uniref:F-box domain-containing protein n=1 Tax=Zea mays TaxID=4577 RepID=A0A1D6HRK4_MAIZE|nr:hypothetical protein ZEAMMB73_Zm00001d018674 [Zea mays]